MNNIKEKLKSLLEPKLVDEIVKEGKIYSFKEGDVITAINGKMIEGVDDLKTQLKDLKEGDSVKVDYKRGGTTQSAEIKIPKRLKTADL